MRSLLFIPGDDGPKLAKGPASGADALILDLEDSVAPDRKQAAREIAAGFVEGVALGPRAQRVYVRLNGFASGLLEDDAAAVTGQGLAGFVLPKSASGADVARLDRLLVALEERRGLKIGALRIIAIATETAASVFGLGSYAGCSPRLEGLAWGGEDLSADLGARGNRDEGGAYAGPYRLARDLCLLGAVAADALPIDAAFTDFRDLEGLEAEARAAARDGFLAKLAIHPAQVPIINTAFTPTDDDLREARAIVEAFERAPGAGVISLHGRMLDRPHLTRAQRTLARARIAAPPPR